MNIIENIDRDALKGMSAWDKVQARKGITKDLLKDNDELRDLFLRSDSAGRKRIADKIYNRLGEKLPELTQVDVGDKTQTSYYQMWPGGTGKPVTKKVGDIMAPVYDEETELLYKAVQDGLVEPAELSKDETIYFGMLAHERRDPLAKKMQAQARKYLDQLIQETDYLSPQYYADPKDPKAQIFEGAFRPFSDFGTWVGEKLGADLSGRKQAEALERLAYPKNVGLEVAGEFAGLLSSGFAGYRELAKRGLGAVIRKEGGKRVLNKGALAATGALEFGLGAAYNTPSMLLSDSDPNRIVSGLEAMALGTAFNLGMDAMFPLKGMTRAEADRHIASLGKPDYAENLQKLADDLQETMQARQLEPAPLPESRNRLAQAAKTQEYQRTIEIDDAVAEIDRRVTQTKGRPGQSKKELGKLQQKKQNLIHEKVLLQTDPPLSKYERMAEEAMPGSVLGISPYGNLANMSKDQLKTLVLKEISLRAATGAAVSASSFGEEHGRIQGFLLGSLLGGIPTLKAGSAGYQKLPTWLQDSLGGIKKGFNKGVTPLDQRLFDINPTLGNVVRKKEMDTLAMSAAAMRRVHPYFERVKRLVKSGRLSEQDAQKLSVAIKSGDENAREQILMAADPSGKTSQSFLRVRKVLDEFDALARQHKIEMGYVQNYFPREVRDYSGLLQNRGIDELAEVEKAHKAYAQKHNTSIDKIPSSIKHQITNDVLSRYKVGRKPAYQQQRKIHDLDVDDLPFYAPDQDAIANYIHRISDHIQTRATLGVTGPGTNYQVAQTFLDESAGAKINDMIEGMAASGQIDRKLINEATDLMRAGFLEASTGAGPRLSAYRNLYYAMQMGNPYSTMTQLSDVALAAVKDPMATKTALGDALKNKRFKVKMEDFGLTQVAEDMKSQSKTGKFLDRVFTASAMKSMDRLGKNTHLSSAFYRLKNQLKNNPAKFKKVQEARFGKDYNDLVDALKRGDMRNENARLAVFNELADMQPITVTGMPEPYVRMKNGRVMYALKSFTVKQFNFVRNYLIRNVKEAQTPKELGDAMKDLAWYAGLFGGATMGINSAKDIMLGRDFNLSDQSLNTMMQLMGLTRYNVYQASELLKGDDLGKNLYSFTGNFLFPLGPVFDATEDTLNTMQGEIKDPLKLETMRYVPGVGKDIYWRVGAGKEKMRKRRARGSKSIEPNFINLGSEIELNF